MNNVDLNQMLQNVASDQGLNCLQFSPAVFDRLMGRKLNLLKF